MPYTDDGIAVGAFHALKKNIVVSCSAGNSGPAPSTLSNLAPWIITVGASTLDRAFVAPVELGNGKKIPGVAVTPHNLEKKMYPLVHAAQIVNPNVPKNETMLRLPGSLSPKAKGKIVFCLRGAGSRIEKDLEVKRAGGIGIITGNNKEIGDELYPDPHFIPGTGVT
ncbi:subtilase family protein [Forsythia ovata]|uniref:Subtilase family protein n=1 Tax=Forsythia ovata TaxID=205694 RepID=A0ABD1R761_9LAMI